ncbi:unnamed protein product [Closterium sp. NIES-54]
MIGCADGGYGNDGGGGCDGSAGRGCGDGGDGGDGGGDGCGDLASYLHHLIIPFISLHLSTPFHSLRASWRTQCWQQNNAYSPSCPNPPPILPASSLPPPSPIIPSPPPPVSPHHLPSRPIQGIMENPVLAADGHTYEREAIEQWLRVHSTSPKTAQHSLVLSPPQPTTHLSTSPNTLLAADGHTYEREAIEQWLRVHSTSPKTGRRLESKALTDNIAVRSMIAEWLEHRLQQRE